MEDRYVVKSCVGHYVSVWRDEINPLGIYEILLIINEPNNVDDNELQELSSMIEDFMSDEDKTNVKLQELQDRIKEICPCDALMIINPNYEVL